MWSSLYINIRKNSSDCCHKGRGSSKDCLTFKDIKLSYPLQSSLLCDFHRIFISRDIMLLPFKGIQCGVFSSFREAISLQSTTEPCPEYKGDIEMVQVHGVCGIPWPQPSAILFLEAKIMATRSLKGPLRLTGFNGCGNLSLIHI